MTRARAAFALALPAQLWARLRELAEAAGRDPRDLGLAALRRGLALVRKEQREAQRLGQRPRFSEELLLEISRVSRTQFCAEFGEEGEKIYDAARLELARREAAREAARTRPE